MTDAFGIVCNYEGDSAISSGAKCWLRFTNGMVERYEFRVRSRGGRWITKYLNLSRVSNWRVAWVPERLRSEVHGMPTRAEAEAYLGRWRV